MRCDVAVETYPQMFAVQYLVFMDIKEAFLSINARPKLGQL